ncbi:MAG: ABC transporter substrate-binding protein [Anaerolineae bacterium]|jgi:peptide/nickel transport system substrate-binding protein|nr:ABC transporter substrate-binding protein [Anaerolineae bacterium]
MKFARLLTLGLLFTLVFSLGFGMVSAQDGATIVIGYEQEPDLPSPLSNSAFSTYLTGLYARDVWGWYGTEREIRPVMVAEIPSFENGLVETVDVEVDPDGDGTMETAQAPVVTYRLREGLLWSDGTPVTADDCLFYHNLMMQPDAVDSFQRGFYPEVVAGAEKVDDLTVRLSYNRPWPDFLNDATLSCAFPAHKFLGQNADGFTMDADGDGVFDANIDDAPYFEAFASSDPAELVGYGPYVLSEFNAGQNAIFTVNPNWGSTPAITTVIFQFILESAQMENAMEVGDIDLAFNFDTVQNGYGAMENVGTFIVPGVFVDAIWMNSGPNAFPAMQDVRVREALVHAIDRRGIADTFSGEGAGEQLTRSWFPPQFTDPNLGFREYDLERARTLLTEAGWVDDNADEAADQANPTPRVSQGVEGLPDGTPLILRFYTSPVVPRPDIQTVIQAQLAMVGVRTQLFVVNGPTVLFASFATRGILNTGQYDLAMYALSNDPLSPNGSPDNFQCAGIPSLENPEGRNSTWFCNEEYDRLDDLVASTNDPEERVTLGYGRDPLFYEAAVWHSIRPRPTGWAVRSDRFDINTISVGTLSGNYFQSIETWQPAS